MKSELAQVLGQSIAAARREAGYTQEELAAKVGMAPRSLQSIEAGKDMPRYSNLFKLAYELNQDPGLLMYAMWQAWLEANESN
jgi:transcriptional regulator with XRE-family HTH domain